VLTIVGMTLVSLAVFGCSVPVTVPPITVLDSGAVFTPATSPDLGNVVQGYVFVPGTIGAGTHMASEFLFASRPTTAGTAAAEVVVGILTGAATAARATYEATTDAGGHFAITVPSTLTDVSGASVRLDFGAATPTYARALGVLTQTIAPGAGLAIRVQRPGFISQTKNVASVENADRVSSIRSFSGSFDCTNQSGGPTTMAVWLSTAAALGLGDLYNASGTPVVADAANHLYLVWEAAGIADGFSGTVQAPWETTQNQDAARDLLNPNSGQAADGSKNVTVYASCRPTGEGVTLSNMTVTLDINARVLSTTGHGDGRPSGAVEFRWF
jgi:hypothetical protein